MEEIDDDDVEGNAPAVILARDGEHLLLRAVAQLALPEPQCVLGKFGCAARERGVVREDLLRRADGDPVVELTHALDVPLGDILGKGRPSDGGLIEQKPVAERGEKKWHARLRIALGKLQRAAFQIQAVLLVLPHAVQLFLLRLKAQRTLVVAAADGLIFARHDAQRRRVRHVVLVAAVVLLQDLHAAFVEANFAEAVDARGDRAVCDDRAIPFKANLGFPDGSALERPVPVVKGAVHCGAHAERILPLRKDDDRLPVAGKLQRVSFDLEHELPRCVFLLLIIAHSPPQCKICSKKACKIGHISYQLQHYVAAHT